MLQENLGEMAHLFMVVPFSCRDPARRRAIQQQPCPLQHGHRPVEGHRPHRLSKQYVDGISEPAEQM